MGMDYKWSGSSSYPRFESELEAVAKVFGGIRYSTVKEKIKNSEGTLDWWFGTIDPNDENYKSFLFPVGVPQIVQDWINQPYNYIDPDNTKKLYAAIADKFSELEIASGQISHELLCDVQYGDPWDISP